MRFRDALSSAGSVMSARAARGGSRRVLVVENDPESRRIVTKVLALEGYETLEATNGRSAIARDGGGLGAGFSAGAPTAATAR